MPYFDFWLLCHFNHICTQTFTYITPYILTRMRTTQKNHSVENQPCSMKYFLICVFCFCGISRFGHFLVLAFLVFSRVGDPKPNNESSKVGKNYSSARQRENRQIELILNGNKEWKILWKSNCLQIQTQEFYKEAFHYYGFFSDNDLKIRNWSL